MTEKGKNYYETKNILFKPMNVLMRNAERLKNTHPINTIHELLKNAIEHGNRVIKIQFLEDKVIIYNSMDQNALDKIIFKHILEKLTTFQEPTQTNFHEGLTTLLLFHASIRTKQYYIENKRSEDGYYQYIQRASHYLDEKEHEIRLFPVENLNGWEVTIYNINTEISGLIKQALKDFYFFKSFKIELEVDGQKWQRKLFEMPKNWKETKIKGSLLYIFEYDTKTKGIVEIYWRLNNQQVFLRIPNNHFNEIGVSGTAILTTIYQFANENRIELAQDVHAFINESVQELRRQNTSEQMLKEEMEKYDGYKEKYREILMKIFKLPANTIDKLFNDTKKERTLLTIRNLLHTLEEIFNPYQEYRIEIPPLFNHPRIPIQMQMETNFHECLRTIQLSLKQFRSIFPKIPLGLKILNGDPEGFLFAGDLSDYTMGVKMLQLIDPSVPFQSIVFFNNTEPLLFPTNPYIEYFINDLTCRYIKSPAEFQKFSTVSPEKLASLSDFVIENTVSAKIKNTYLIPSEIIIEKTPKSNTAIQITKKNWVEYQGTKFELSIYQQVKWKIPIIYEKADQVKIDTLMQKSAEKREEIGKFYIALGTSIQLLLQNSENFKGKSVYPVLLYKTGGPEGLYMVDYRILAFNVNHIPNHKNKIAAACMLLDLVAHELAHDNAPNHGRIHEQCMESYLRIAKSVDKISGKFIIDLISALL